MFEVIGSIISGAAETISGAAETISEAGKTIGEAGKTVIEAGKSGGGGFGGEFARAFKEDSGFGGDFAEAFKAEGGFGKDFAEAFRNDSGFDKDFKPHGNDNVFDKDYKPELNMKDELPKPDKDTPEWHRKDGEELPNIRYFAREDTPQITIDEKTKLKEETGWSDKIIDSIETKEQADLLKNSNLEEKEIDGRPALVKTDIDWEQKDELGLTNKERAQKGNAPLDKNGKPIELHHMEQKRDGPLVELTHEEHRAKGSDGGEVLHDPHQDTEIDRGKFKQEKKAHWKARAEALKE